MSFYKSGRSAKVLRIVINGGLGDHLLVSPLIRHFRRSGRYERLIAVVNDRAIEIYDRSPRLDQVIACSSRDLYFWALPEPGCDVFSPYFKISDPGRPHDVFDVQVRQLFNFNQGRGSVLRQLKAHYHIRFAGENGEMFVDPDDELWADRALSSWKGRKIVLLHLSGSSAQKKYPGAHWRKVIDILSTHKGIAFLQIGKGKERIPGIRQPGSSVGLRRTAALVKRAACLVTADSFPGHLAWAMSKPAVVLFGPSNPEAFGHPGNINLRSRICPPCADTPRRPACRNSRCLAAISPAEVADAVLSLL